MNVVVAIVLGCSAVYLVWHWARIRKRNRASWESILSRLKLDWDARDLSVPERSHAEQQRGMLARSQRARQARGLWAMFANAGVLVELADYAARNGAPEDQATVDAIRAEATLIRLKVLGCVSQYALHAAEERILHSVLCAEQAYTQLEYYVTELMEQQRMDLAPAQLPASAA